MPLCLSAFVRQSYSNIEKNYITFHLQQCFSLLIRVILFILRIKARCEYLHARQTSAPRTSSTCIRRTKRPDHYLKISHPVLPLEFRPRFHPHLTAHHGEIQAAFPEHPPHIKLHSQERCQADHIKTGRFRTRTPAYFSYAISTDTCISYCGMLEPNRHHTPPRDEPGPHIFVSALPSLYCIRYPSSSSLSSGSLSTTITTFSSGLST